MVNESLHKAALFLADVIVAIVVEIVGRHLARLGRGSGLLLHGLGGLDLLLGDGGLLLHSYFLGSLLSWFSGIKFLIRLGLLLERVTSLLCLFILMGSLGVLIGLSLLLCLSIIGLLGRLIFDLGQSIAGLLMKLSSGSGQRILIASLECLKSLLSKGLNLLTLLRVFHAACLLLKVIESSLSELLDRLFVLLLGLFGLLEETIGSLGISWCFSRNWSGSGGRGSSWRRCRSLRNRRSLLLSRLLIWLFLRLGRNGLVRLLNLVLDWLLFESWSLSSNSLLLGLGFRLLSFAYLLRSSTYDHRDVLLAVGGLLLLSRRVTTVSCGSGLIIDL